MTIRQPITSYIILKEQYNLSVFQDLIRHNRHKFHSQMALFILMFRIRHNGCNFCGHFQTFYTIDTPFFMIFSQVEEFILVALRVHNIKINVYNLNGRATEGSFNNFPYGIRLISPLTFRKSTK